MIEMDAPMSDVHKRQLKLALPQLEYCIELQPVLCQLFLSETISDQEMNLLNSNASRTTMVTNLIELLLQKSDSAFENLMIALDKVDQMHIGMLIESKDNYTICITMLFVTMKRQF